MPILCTVHVHAEQRLCYAIYYVDHPVEILTELEIWLTRLFLSDGSKCRDNNLVAIEQGWKPDPMFMIVFVIVVISNAHRNVATNINTGSGLISQIFPVSAKMTPSNIIKN